MICYIATGGSAFAAGQLVEQNGGKLVENVFFIELTALGGAKKLQAPTYSVVQFDD
jgi:adenine phosphoribosyltransferase